MVCHLEQSIVHLNCLLLSSYSVWVGDQKFFTHHEFSWKYGSLKGTGVKDAKPKQSELHT